MESNSGGGGGGGGGLGMFDDDDLLAPFDDFDAVDINEDELLEAFSSGNNNNQLFDGIDVDGDFEISALAAPPSITLPPINMQNNNIDMSVPPSQPNFASNLGATGALIEPVTLVSTFRRGPLDNELEGIAGANPGLYKTKRKPKNKKKPTHRKFNSNPNVEPLFSGWMRSHSDINNNDDDVSVSDVASACSAPADLMALCGLYDDPSSTSADMLDVQNMFLNPKQHFQRHQQQPLGSNFGAMGETIFPVGGGSHDDETMLIRQRQQQLLQEERQLQEAASAATAAHRPRRRRTFTFDGVSFGHMMQVVGSGVNPIYGDNNMTMNSMFGNNNTMSGETQVQMKRRKSESAIQDFYGVGGEFQDDPFGINGGNNNLNQLTHSVDPVYPSMSYSSNDAGMRTELDAAVQEAEEKINHLKQLLYASQNRGGEMGGTEEAGQGQQQQEQIQQPATNSWWASLESELGTGLNLNQNAEDLTIPSKAPKKSSKKKSPKKKPDEPSVTAEIPLPDKPDPEILKLDPNKLMAKLQESMNRTSNSMKQLQEWDRANGLPKSHSQTMVNSNRSRKQLAEGVVMQKWNDIPLRSSDTDGSMEDETQK